MRALFADVYKNMTVMVTGNTGFKGSWLTAWLVELGANVVGYSLPQPPTKPSNFEICKLDRHIIDVRGDIRDLDHVQQTIATYRPQILFHLAAQPIVLRSLAEPKLTFDTNVAGTVNVLEAIRTTDSVRAVVCITTDKVYRNQAWPWGYRENDSLGDDDPYGASKAMAELAITSYRQTYFAAGQYARHGVALASVRAGNVIGGGDFADFRLVPDCMRALTVGEPIRLRIPENVRPWQHVLEPLSGYLWLAVQLLQQGPAFAEAWNFGPLEQQSVTAQAIAEKLITLWGSGSWVRVCPAADKVEARELRLSWDKVASRLRWRPVYTWEEALAEIVDWCKAFQQSQDMYQVCRDHIGAYCRRARELGLGWAVSVLSACHQSDAVSSMTALAQC